MNILLLAPNLGFQGGLERHVFDLAAGLRGRGHAVSLAYRVASGRDRARYASVFHDVIKIPAARSMFRAADVVYAHKVVEEDAIAAVPSSTPLVAMIHDHDATCVRSSRLLPIHGDPCDAPPGVGCVTRGCIAVRDRHGVLPIAIRSPFRLARETRALGARARLVAGSAYMRLTLLDAGVKPESVEVIHPVSPEDPAPIVPLPKDPIVAFAGQVIRGKGLDLLLRAMAWLPGARLLVAGDGSGMPAARALAKELGIEGRVDFLGAIAPDRVHEVYDRARVVAVPSRWPEPFGMIGVEAMRRARPVVGAWHGGIPEWLSSGETGMGFRPGDVEDLREALRFALEEAPLEAMGQAALERASSRFSFAAMLDRVECLLTR